MATELKTYAFEYFHEGSNWAFHIKARSHEDAQARINKLPHAKPIGELMAIIPAAPGVGWFVRAMCWLRNKVLA